MKAKHAHAIRKGILRGRNYLWLGVYGCHPKMLEIVYTQAIRSLSTAGLRAFKRTIGSPDAW